MTRRKREIVGLTNERDFPHLVELAVPPEGFRSAFLEFDPTETWMAQDCCSAYLPHCLPISPDILSCFDGVN
jgi:hypothetical protein